MKGNAGEDCEFFKVAVVGLGYIGLPTAAAFATRNVKVIGVDTSENVVATLNAGGVHFVEPDLELAVSKAVEKGFLRATQRPKPADAFMIAVPTPLRRLKNGQLDPDLSFIEAAARSIAPVLRKGNLVVLESTSPVGATELMAGWLASERPDLSFPQTAGEQADVNIAHCPERVLPGRVMRELVENDRVIGGMTSRCAQRAVSLYKTFVEGECVKTTARTAEMAKLAENSFRDVNIAFANELSMICERLEIDIWELIAVANRHPRVNILQPGPGVGGHCIAVDPWFIVSQTPELACLIRTAREVNGSKPEWVIEQVQRAVGEVLQKNPRKTSRDVTLVCYGLAFKADIDDLRESPALGIAERLAGLHPGPLKVVEPHIRQLPEKLRIGVELVDYESAEGDVHILLVDHRAFRAFPAPQGLRIDTRGFWRRG